MGLLSLLLPASAAQAGPGYRIDSSQSPIPLGGEVPSGVAVDQVTHDIYVAELSTALIPNLVPGQVEQLDESGAPTADSPFSAGNQDFFIGVGVNPLTGGIYAYQAEGETLLGRRGVSKMSSFSSSGVLGTSFSPDNSSARALAVDSSGRVYFPNSANASVQVFDSSGALKDTITCAGCAGGVFSEPVATAFDSAANLYVVDRGGSGRVIELSPSGGSYAYHSTLQSGGSPVAIGIDVASDDAFVGNRVGSAYHVIAYDSSGVAFDDFGASLVHSSIAETATPQLAVNAATSALYLSDPGGEELFVFEPVGSIPAPTASVTAPSPVGQVEATLRAEVNPKAHVLTTCHFEYTTHADFLANGYANAKTAACPAVVGSPETTTITSAVTGLTPGVSYDYRVQIASFGGSAESGPQSFETLPPIPPEVTTGSATAITMTSATLGGSVNPKGGKNTNCHFEYINEASFLQAGFSGASSKLCTQIPSGDVSKAVSTAVSGLKAGTTYRFRLVSTNNAGTTQAPDKSFATVAETCAMNPALCPPPPGPAQIPASEPPPSPTMPAPPTPKPFKCRKGFKKKRVHGKLKCVRVKKARSKR